MLYRTKDLVPFTWSFVNEGGFARPYFYITPRNRVHIVMMELYDLEKVQKGTVTRQNMNLRTVYGFEDWVGNIDQSRWEAKYDLDPDGKSIETWRK